jgi:hypothetical protein
MNLYLNVGSGQQDMKMIARTHSNRSPMGHQIVLAQSKQTRLRSCVEFVDLHYSLAYAEFRLILARMIWNFDFALAEHSRNWMEQHLSYLIWQKPTLYVHLRPRDNPPARVRMTEFGPSWYIDKSWSHGKINSYADKLCAGRSRGHRCCAVVDRNIAKDFGYCRSPEEAGASDQSLHIHFLVRLILALAASVAVRNS